MNAAMYSKASRCLLSALAGFVLLGVPTKAPGQSVEERARIERQLREVETRLAQLREERQESLERVREEIAASEREMRRVQEEALARVHEDVRARQEVAQEAQARARILTEERIRELRERAEEMRLRERGRVRELQQVVIRTRARIRLGLSFSSSQPEEVSRQGARVESVMDGSPAQEAGIQEGDIITHLNGRSLVSPLSDEEARDFADDEPLPVQRLIALARDLEEGDEVELRYLRNGAEETVRFEAADMEEPTVTFFRGSEGGSPLVFHLDPENRMRWEYAIPDSGRFHFRMPEGRAWGEVHVPELDLWRGEEGPLRGLYLRNPEGMTSVMTLGSGLGVLGLRLFSLNPELGEYFSASEGVLVLDVEEGSELGLAPGDVILSIDGRAVEDPSDVRRILGSYEEDETVAFSVTRKGRELTVEGRVK